jgi:hypothetical protein
LSIVVGEPSVLLIDDLPDLSDALGSLVSKANVLRLEESTIDPRVELLSLMM